mmetsp:Transcript_19787/g.36939  ORF Transcript_19787/g.36939 Transcript_19787/m.36939 type:complete len:122 (-) Transcript_19787:91-456(-)
MPVAVMFSDSTSFTNHFVFRRKKSSILVVFIFPGGWCFAILVLAKSECIVCVTLILVAGREETGRTTRGRLKSPSLAFFEEGSIGLRLSLLRPDFELGAVASGEKMLRCDGRGRCCCVTTS